MSLLPGGRRIRAALTIAAVATGVTVAGLALAAPAQASVSFCKSAPEPQLPGTGLSGWIAGQHHQLPGAGAPPARGSFADTEYERYGFAGLRWGTYDQGCIPNPLNSTGHALDTQSGNILLGAATFIVATDNAVHRWADSPDATSALNPVVVTAERVVHDAIFTPWAAITIMILALTLVARAHKGDLAGATASVGWALLVLALVGGITHYPLVAGHLANSAMASTIGDMDAGFTGTAGRADWQQAHDNLIVGSVLWPAWLQGNFGSANTPAARAYGPRILQNQALTWQQAAGSPAQVSAAVAAEGKRWEAAAAQLQSANPVAYSYLQGNQGNRLGSGVLALVLALIVCTFDVLCSLVIIVAMMMVLLTVIVLPGLAVVGIHHSMRHVLLGLLSRVAGMMISAVLYSAAAGVEAKATQVLLTHNRSTNPLPFLILAVLPIALFIVIRRTRAHRVLPRPLMALAAYAGLNRGLRRGAAAGVREGMTHHYWGGDENNLTVNLFGWPGMPDPDNSAASAGGWAAWPAARPVGGSSAALEGAGGGVGGGSPPDPDGGPPPGPDVPPGPGGGGGSGGGRPSWPNGPGWQQRPWPDTSGGGGNGSDGGPRTYDGGGSAAAPSTIPMTRRDAPGGGSEYVYDGGAGANGGGPDLGGSDAS
jgi:hypothetical protein